MSEAGAGDVEGVVVEGEVGRASLTPVDRYDVGGCGVRTCVLEHGRDDIQPRDVGASTSGGDGDVSRPTPDIEDDIACIDVCSVDNVSRHTQKVRGDVGVGSQ